MCVVTWWSSGCHNSRLIAERSQVCLPVGHYCNTTLGKSVIPRASVTYSINWYLQWLKCKIRGEGTAHSDLDPLSVALCILLAL